MASISKSIAEYILKRPGLTSRIQPIAQAYVNLAGYRRIGLRYDDLLEEENDIVQEALRRLPKKEQYARAYRIRLAQQCGITHTELPRDQWVKPEEDIRYLTPIVDEVKAEFAERLEMDSAIPQKRPKAGTTATPSKIPGSGRSGV